MSHPRFHLTILLLLAAMPASAQERGRVHELNASAATTHIGFFDATLEPVLRIESGDVVRLATASTTPGWLQNQGVARERIPEELFRVYEGELRLRQPISGPFTGRGDHTLNGPIYVEGTEPGDMLEVRTHYMTMGLDRDLDQAALIATTEMIDFLVATRGLDRETAIALSRVAMDLVVTQIVDGTKGIHALIPKSIFER